MNIEIVSNGFEMFFFSPFKAHPLIFLTTFSSIIHSPLFINKKLYQGWRFSCFANGNKKSRTYFNDA